MVALPGSTQAAGMDEAWFTGFADELAQCLLDAERAAEACEALLETGEPSDDPELKQVLVDALVAPAAVARILIELIDQPPSLVLAACRLCREVASTSVEQLAALGSRVDSAQTIAALRTASGSCDRLLEAVG
jgi:hypothetical protein